MKKKDLPGQFSSPKERQAAIDALELEIRRLTDEIDESYCRLGRYFYALTEQETAGINEMTDKIVEHKQKLRKLKEKDAKENR